MRAITGIQYRSLKGLQNLIPLVIPKPTSIDQWVRIADQQNYTIKSNLYTMLAARETIKQNEAARYPTLVGQASYGTTTTGTIAGLGTAAPGAGGGVSNIVTTSGSLGLALDFPVFQGGYVSASTKQAKYNYLSASDQLEFQHRTVVNQTRQAFLGVESGISQIQADAQAIKSARNKLEATQAGYSVGTRTMVDVLNAVSDLTQAQQTWATDRYSYVLSIVTLEQQAGTLSPESLAQINAWLSQAEVFNPEKKVSISRYSKAPLPTPSEFAAPPKGGQPARIFHHPLPPSTAVIPTVAPTMPKTHIPPTVASPQSNIENHYYSIQVYANSSVEKAHEFLNHHSLQLKEPMQILYSPQPEPGWYKVIYGHYATKTEANSALKQIPLGLKQYRPWIIEVPKTPKKAGQDTTQPLSSPSLSPPQKTLLPMP